jgi:beta-exotoxin I transport system ATP-binding protein
VTAIRTIGLTKLYGPIRALDGLDLDVREGEVFGFLGPNGAGKSTAIRLLLGYIHPSAGSGEVLGCDIVTASARLRRQIGYLPGGIAFYDTLTGLEHLEFLARLNHRAPVRRAELCDRLELTDKTLRRMVRDYSRGMRQKLGIVQALQHDPELAVLDEPSEGLDPLMQRAFYGILEQLKHDGRTVFFSSHVLSEVERVCDRVAIIRNGRLAVVEEIAALRARRSRNVTVQFDGAPPRLHDVSGVSEVEARGSRLTCRVSGDIGPFLAALAQGRVVDLTIEVPRLEEAFLGFYDEAGAP